MKRRTEISNSIEHLQMDDGVSVKVPRPSRPGPGPGVRRLAGRPVFLEGNIYSLRVSLRRHNPPFCSFCWGFRTVYIIFLPGGAAPPVSPRSMSRFQGLDGLAAEIVERYVVNRCKLEFPIYLNSDRSFLGTLPDSFSDPPKALSAGLHSVR